MQVTIGNIVKETGLTKPQVIYRLNFLGITGVKAQETITLYDDSVIEQVKNCVLPSEKKEQ
jgi:hypothetical protein